MGEDGGEGWVRRTEERDPISQPRRERATKLGQAVTLDCRRLLDEGEGEDEGDGEGEGKGGGEGAREGEFILGVG